MSDNLEILLTSGFDAFSNLYDVEITLPENVEAANPITSSTYMVRAMDFIPPTLGLGEYQSHYKTIDITRMNAMFSEGSREFSIKIRIDANWRLYTLAKKWKNLYSNVSNDTIKLGTLSNSVTAGDYGSFKIKAATTNGGTLSTSGVVDPELYWQFSSVMLYDMVEPQFDRSSSSPIDIDCKCMFGKYIVGTSVSPIIAGGA